MTEIISNDIEKVTKQSPPSTDLSPPALSEEKTFLTAISDAPAQTASDAVAHTTNPSELVDVIANIKAMSTNVPPIPPTVEAATVLLDAVDAVDVPQNSRALLCRHATSQHSIRLYEAAFHYVTIVAFTDAAAFAVQSAQLFTRMSRHFLSIFVTLSAAHRDVFCQYYYQVLARALYDGLFRAYDQQWKIMRLRRAGIEHNVAFGNKQHKQMTVDDRLPTPVSFAITFDQIVSRCAEWTLGFIPATSTQRSKSSRRASISTPTPDEQLFVYKQRVALAQSQMISHVVPSAYNKINMMLTVTSPTRLPSLSQRPTHIYNDAMIQPIYESLTAAQELTRTTRKAFRQSKWDLLRSERIESADLFERHHKLSQSEHVALQKDNVNAEAAALITHWQTNEYRKWKAKGRTLSLRKVAAQQVNKQTSERTSLR